MIARKIRLKPRDRLALLGDLGTMLGAGVSILEAIDALQIDAKGHMEAALKQLRRGLSNGEPLSSIMERMPNAFDPITINLIRAAEAGGTLEDTLKDIVVATKKEIAFNETLKNAAIYPIFVMSVFMGVVLLMLTFVVPRVAKVFENLRVNMPLITRITITASDYFLQYWFVIVPVFVLLIVGIVFLFRAQRRRIVRAILKLPGLKKLGTNIDLARFTRSFGLLMRSGVAIQDALRLSESVVQRREIAAVIEQMRKDVISGLPLSQHLRDTDGVIPVIMSRSIETAETSGTLDSSLQQLSEHFENEVNETIKILTALLEPILIVFIGVLVGGLMVTIIAPIYNLISQISPSS